MANQFEIYKCELCGNVIEVLFAGSGGPLSCCGQPMKLMADKAIDGAKEKHVPVIEANGAGCKVKVGSAPHVMEETHWIEWIEIATADGKRYKKFLKPGDAPEADFCMAMANLLENAVEACERAVREEAGADGRGSTAQDGARPLFVDAEARIEGNAVLVSVRNSCTPSDARALAAAAPDGVLSSDVRSAKREGDGGYAGEALPGRGAS